MKKNKIVLGLLSLMAFVGCTKEEYPNDLIDVSWYTSQLNGEEYYASEGDFMAFMDLSQGALSHKWILEDGSYFLKDGFKRADSLPLFIDEELGLQSTEHAISVLFTKPGINKVRLYNTFPEKVSYNSENFPFEAVEKDGVWVIDKTFNVDVFAEIKPAYKVIKIVEDLEGNVTEEELLNVTADMEVSSDSDTWPTEEVEVGGRLKFVDMTTVGRANSRKWTIYNSGAGTTSKDSVAEIYFSKLNFTSKLGSLNMYRETDGKIPGASASKLIPLKIKVVPSQKPFKFAGNLVESDGESIMFNVSQEAQSFTGLEGAFNVHVKNGDFEQDIPVQTAKVYAMDATKIKLVLSQPIYGTDTITVSYDDSFGKITSTGGKDLLSFNDELVTMNAGAEILNSEVAGFEMESTKQTEAYAGSSFWISPNTNDTYKRVTSQSNTGAASMRFECSDVADFERKLMFNWFDSNGAPLTPGTYKMSFKIFIEAENTMDVIGLQLLDTKSWKNHFNEKINISSVTKGQWEEVEFEFVLGTELAETVKKQFRIVTLKADNPNISGVQRLYLDDLSLKYVDVRP